MPVDKFGHTDSGSIQRVVAGGVTLTQVKFTFVRRDGTNAFTGNLDLGGNSIEGLSTTYTPSEDNNLTNKKYVDRRVASNATRDYVSGIKVSPGNLVRNTTSGIIYRFEGTAGPITAAPALSSNWRPTAGAAICVLREAPEGVEIRVVGVGNPTGFAMHDRLTIIVINTDSAYTTANGLITIPRSGVYRLGGFVNILYLTTPTPSSSFLRVSYTINRRGETENMAYGVQIDTGGTREDTSTTLHYPAVSVVAGDQIGIRIATNASCYTATYGSGPGGGCGLQVEVLY